MTRIGSFSPLRLPDHGMRETRQPEVEAPGESPSIVGKLLEPFVVKNNPLAPPPPAAPSELKVMTFNVRLGGEDMHGIRKTLVEAKPDMVGLQEVSRANAEKLAKDMGMHLTFYQSVRHNNGLDNGKAILSRYPIQESESLAFDISVTHRLGALWDRLKNGGIMTSSPLWQKRSLLRSTFTIGGKSVDVIDTHLATGDPKANASQLRQLQAYVAERKKLGHEVILLGDFNLAFNRTPQNAPKEAEALGEWAELQEQLSDAFKTAPVVTVTNDAGQLMTPGQAREQLKQEGLSEAERKVLLRAANGATLGRGNSRIDTILSSEGLQATSLHIDQQNDASDHEPVVATFKLDN